MSDFFKKTTSSILMIAIIASSSFFINNKKTYAQFGGIFGGGSSGNASTGVAVTGGLAGVAVNCGISFFAARKARRAAGQLADQATDAINSAVGSASESLIGVNVAGLASGDIEPAVPTRSINVPEEVKKVEDENILQGFKEECLDAVARYLVLRLIDKITLMTVEWINSGFEGNPFYPENRENFFESIAKDELRNFTAWFSASPADFPWGRKISEMILMTVQNRLEDNLRFSMNQVLAHQFQYATYESFQVNFSVGGWAGYRAMIQPNNNIFGNYLLASGHLNRRVSGTSINVAQKFQAELNEGLGFLNQRICRLSNNGADDYIPRTNGQHLGGYIEMPLGGNVEDIESMLPPDVASAMSGLSSDAKRQYYNELVRRSNCARWETVTPGRVIAEKTTTMLGSPLRNLELADELNENLGLIADALFAQLFRQGLRSFYNAAGYSSNPNDANYNAVWAQTQDGSHGSTYNQPTITSSFGVSPDGTTTPNSGIIQIQQNYLQLAGQTLDNLAILIRDTRALDFCVPGPNPVWYQNGYQNLQSTLSSLPTGLTFPNQTDAQQYYAQLVNEIFGITIAPTPLIANQTSFNQFMIHVMNKYAERLSQDYSLTPNPPPSMRAIAASLFNQISIHQISINSLQNRVNALAGSMPVLEDIQTQLLSLPPDVLSDPQSPQMQIIESMFSQIVNQGVMVTIEEYNQLQSMNENYQSQISYVNNLISQCVSETTIQAYIQQNPTERIVYPFMSIYENPSMQQLPTPQQSFIPAANFGGPGSQIDISVFGGGSISVSSSPNTIFATNILSIY